MVEFGRRRGIQDVSTFARFCTLFRTFLYLCSWDIVLYFSFSYTALVEFFILIKLY